MIATRRAALLLLLLGLGAQARASGPRTVEEFVLPADATVSNELLLAVDSARIEGSALDDVFVFAGRSIEISGHLAGDAWLCASAIVIPGRVDDHVRAAGQTVTIRGTLQRGLAAAAATVLLDTNSTVRGEVVVAGENIVLQGQVDGPVRAIGQAATVGGTVNGDIHLTAADIVVIPGTSIRGDLYYTSPKELFLDRSVDLGGKLIRQPIAASAPATRKQILSLVALRAMQALAAFLVGFPFTFLFPRVAGDAVRSLGHMPGRTLLTGFASLFIFPLLALIAFVTVIGIPLALILMGLFLALFYMGKISVATYVGIRLLGTRLPRHPVAAGAVALASGLILLYALAELPVVGGSIALLVGILGLGALLLTVLRSGRRRSEPPDVPSSQVASEQQAGS